MVVLVVALIAGWSWFWHYAAGQAQIAIDGWRAREAKAGRIYACGSQTIGGFPFRIEVECDKASALFRSNQPPVEIKASGMLIAAQIYQPNLLITEFHGPLTIADPGKPPNIVVNWKLAQSSVRGTPQAPERVSLVFDKPAVERVNGTNRQYVLRAQHIEIHGRLIGGSVTNKPVIETVLRLKQALAPEVYLAATQPVDADITAVLRGLDNFAPKPWAARFRELQAAGGRIDITAARVQRGETIVVGGGALGLSANGRLQGQLRVTIAGLEPFLASINAPQAVQSSPDMDKVAGALDRLLPGLGGVARQQATSSNLSLGINLLGERTTLEGRPAVVLPLHFDDGSVFLGPIKIGDAPALF
ncbi:MAG: DUF2125 domain-containing protein [Pseudolabrys sp.]